MNDYSSYSSAPPSEASAAAAAYNSARCQSTIDNVTRWLQQYESEAEVSENRAHLLEAELTRRLAMLQATGTNTPSSLSRNVSEQSIARPDQYASPSFHALAGMPINQMVRHPLTLGHEGPAVHRVSSSALTSNKRGWDTCPAGSSKQPRISDPTLATDIPFEPPSFSQQMSKEEGGMLTPPSSAAHSMDNAPPLPPRESVTSTNTIQPAQLETLSISAAPPLPPRPAGLVTSGVELHVSSPTPSISSISFHVAKQPNQQNQWGTSPHPPNQFYEQGARGFSMPPAPPGSVSSSAPFSPAFGSDMRVLSLPQQGANAGAQFRSKQLFRQLPRHFQVVASTSPVPQLHHQYWSQVPSSTGLSQTQSHAVSNLNYSVFPDHSQNLNESQALSNCGSVISFNTGSNYAIYDAQPAGSNFDLERLGEGPQQYHVSSRHMFVQQGTSSALPRRPRRVVTSPLPDRRQRNSARLEEGTLSSSTGRESYSNSRNYSSEAYKFFMEQHVENLIRSSLQRKERLLQFDQFMTSQNLNGEAECRPFRLLHFKRESTYLRLKRARLQPSFFQPLKTLGIGAFGEVSLVRKTDTNKLYAMKTLRKVDVIKRNQVAHVKAERDILAEANSDWVVKLFFSFQDRDNLYFIMDYIPGGDLMNLLIKFGIFSEPMARFYTAELVAALEYVHSMGFIHRDIKPDNVLIDRDGHVKLTDFGLCTGFRWTHQSNRYAKIRPEEPIWIGHEPSRVAIPEIASDNASSMMLPARHRRVHSLVGTPNYIAPEVVLKSGYNHSCDWWSVGVILYEMLVGRPPFMSETPAETQYKIINWKQYLYFPPGVGLSKHADDLIRALIRDADSRLGAFGGAADIKAHPFFGNIDFENLRRQPAIYVPILKHEMDTSNFDPSQQGGQPIDFPEAQGPVHVGPAAFSFYEFTFRRFCDDAGCPLPTPLSLAAASLAQNLSDIKLGNTVAASQLTNPQSTNEHADPTAVSAKPPLPPPPLPPRPAVALSASGKPPICPSPVVCVSAATSNTKPLPPSSSSTNPTFV